ncbi:hypothetical protein [Lentibacillus saliphilus]|uniref:hypothetical protein n=1 Tax=Lentibacillus saliphilus TaxID=2737028 RepID=UPI001C2FE1E1|nr:hypothetical protein [Lentibacillus saliphilus]
MSLNKVTTRQIVMKQYQYKLKAYYQVFNSMVILQVIALLFSTGGIMFRGGRGFGLDISLNTYTADMIIIFTFLWAFINAITITTKAYREDDFIFVTNRQTQHLSNMLFLITASVIGGVTAVLVGYLNDIIFFFTTDPKTFAGYSELITPFDVLTGVVATSLYVLMFCAAGYLVGVIIQLNRIFTVIIPVLIIGFLIVGGQTEGIPVNVRIYLFYVGETDVLLFMLKSLVTSALIFAGSFFLLRNKEVRV